MATLLITGILKEIEKDTLNLFLYFTCFDCNMVKNIYFF